MAGVAWCRRPSSQQETVLLSSPFALCIRFHTRQKHTFNVAFCCRAANSLRAHTLCRTGRAQEVERRWAVRHEWGGQKVYQMIADIGGYYVKTAQILASKRELVPEQWCVRLSKLWDDLEPRPWPNVRASVASGLRDTDVGRRLLAAGAARRTNELPQAVFSSLQQAPLAAASIAQVHAAELSAAALRLLAAATTTTAPAAIDSCDEAGPASEGPGFSPPASASALASASVAASASAASVAAWHHGPQVVVKVQHADVRPLMSADLRNMGRVGRFLSGMLPFDVMPAIREMQARAEYVHCDDQTAAGSRRAAPLSLWSPQKRYECQYVLPDACWKPRHVHRGWKC